MRPQLPLAGLLLLGSISFTSAQENPESRPSALSNPPAFQHYVAPPSEPMRFLASEEGKAMLLHSPHPKAQEWLRMFHGEAAAQLYSPPPSSGERLTSQNPSLPGNPAVPSRPGTSLPGAAQAPGSKSAPFGVMPHPGVTPPITGQAAPVQSCGGAYGLRFNLEPRPEALPQNDESVALLYGQGASGSDVVVMGANDYRGMAAVGTFGGSLSGYYVHTTGAGSAGCGIQFEGGLPTIPNPLNPVDELYGGGDPVVVADPARNAFFYADLRFDYSVYGVGVMRTHTGRLNSSTFCPAGTHTGDTAALCWQTGALLNPTPYVYPAYAYLDRPHLTVDPRSVGTGAGNVYATMTRYNGYPTYTTAIQLVVCDNNLVSCSPPVTVSGSDSDVTFSQVQVIPSGGSAGKVTLSYVNIASGRTRSGLTGYHYQIKWVVCTPNGAPNAPTCSPPTLVYDEHTPLVGNVSGVANSAIYTYPKHVHQDQGGGSISTYVIWDKCKTALPLGSYSFYTYNCPDADIVEVYSFTGASPTPIWATVPIVVNAGPGHQILSSPFTDPSTQTVNIVYLNSNADLFRHRFAVTLTQFTPNGAILPPTALAPGLNDPAADPYLSGNIGGYIGVTANGTGVGGQSHLYTGFTSNTTAGTYYGVSALEPNNNISYFTY